MPRIYCSVCADTSSLPGSACLHCGAVARESNYELSPHNLVALAIVVVLAVVAVWGFARDAAPKAVVEPGVQQTSPLNGAIPGTPDDVAQNSSVSTRTPGKRDT